MGKTFIKFFFIFLFGLVVQTIFAHTFYPARIAPDIILILMVFVAVEHHSPAGVAGAFLLGLASDFASAQYLGPDAAAGIMVFLFITLVARNVYAEHALTFSILVAVALPLKKLTTAGLIAFYTNHPLNTALFFSKNFAGELLLTVIIAPLVMFMLSKAQRIPSRDTVRRQTLERFQ
ncbi:rod shape-determining protein MreD [bacterium]|nr:rod shape-determining protein MreD [bacterium]